MTLESSDILSVRAFSFPSILTNKYMEITIGNPRFAILEYISSNLFTSNYLNKGLSALN